MTLRELVIFEPFFFLFAVFNVESNATADTLHEISAFFKEGNNVAVSVVCFDFQWLDH